MMVAGEFWHGATARGLVGGFRALGWDVAEVDILRFVVTGRGFLSRAAGRLLWRNAIAEYNAEILRVAELNRIEIVLTIKGVNISRSTVEALQANGTKVVVFYPDVLFDHVGVDEATLAAADLIVTTKSYHAPYLDRLVGPARHAFVHHGYCPSAHSRRHAPDAIPYRWDIGFIGNASPHKAAYLTAAVQTFPNERFVVAGPQYPGTESWPRNVTYEPHLPPAEHRAFYNSQRFTLNVTRRDMIAAGWSPSVRLFEAAACGTPIISDRWAGLDSLFAPGREILLASRADQVRAVLRDFGEEERLELAARARARILAEHTAAHRAEQLEGYALELLGDTEAAT